MGREDSLKAVLGDDKFIAVRQSKVLLIGAGGIGCELLKDLLLLGYGEIHIVDLDTIDLSNLNRQFLFRHKDIKQPKSTTAVKAVESFNFFRTKLIPYQGSIFDTDLFPLSWFRQFDIFFSALDNIPARAYINKIALFLNKVIMESGTTGVNGNCGPTFPYKTDCYDCIHRDTPKSFPVCTIRSTPSQPVHCIHWAKSFLFNQLFAEDEEPLVQPEGKDAEALGTDNEEEIKNLVSESNELIELKKAISSDDFAEKVINKVFINDIEKLLLITDLWKTRTKPTPLDFNKFKDDVSTIEEKDLGTGQKLWSIEQNLKVLISSIENLQKRIKTEKEIEFDKDDEDTLNFVVASANIRSFIFDIPLKSKFDIKSIAGNIIPAIATTNAIIAGFSALMSLKQYSSTQQEAIDQSSTIYITSLSDKFITKSFLTPPNPECGTCSVIRGVVNIDNSKTVEDLINSFIEKYGFDEDLSISIGSRLLYDIDFDDNKETKLIDLGVLYGVHLGFSDETDVKKSVEFYVELNSNGEINFPELEIPNKPVVEKVEEDENDDDDELELIQDDGDEDLMIVEPFPEKRKAGEVGNEQQIKKPKLDEI